MEEKLMRKNPVASLRHAVPLVHHLTNYVTMNDCANITIAIGASPVMSASAEEAPQLAAIAGALVINMGTPEARSIEAIFAAGKVALERGIPVVFDPVGAGATAYRRELSVRIMEELKPSIVKGNAAEIAFLAGSPSSQRGVDSLEKTASAPVRTLARRYGCVAVSTGEVDYVSDGSQCWAIRGGNEALGRVCGSGCMSASVIASFAATPTLTRAEAALSSCLVFKCAGDDALKKVGDGRLLSSFRWAFMDAVGAMGDAVLSAYAMDHCELFHD